MTAVRPIASAISARREVGSMAWAREAGCSSRTVKTQAATMKAPRPAASIAYSGQCALKAARGVIESTPDRAPLDELGDAPRLGGRASRGEGRLRAENLRHGAQA